MIFSFVHIQETQEQINYLVEQNEKLHVQNEQLIQQLENQEKEVTAIMDENIILKQALEKKSAEFRKEVTRLKRELEKAKKPQPTVSRSNSPTSKTLFMKATAYTAYCKGCSGTTRTGINLRENPDKKVIAVDPRVIPLGTKVWVEGYGYAIAGDTGGAIKGNKIDVFIPSRKEALQWGNKTVTVRVLASN